MFMLGLAGITLAETTYDNHVLVTHINGNINPVSERVISSTIKKGEDEGASLVIIVLDTPGGLLSSTRSIVESLLNAQIPTAVYVAPNGARAASAGTFVTIAAHFAIMAPVTNIGAATPVDERGKDLPSTLANKATNDAAALMRSIAAERGRNAPKLEDSVMKGASYTSEEAVELGIVDFIATDINNVLQTLNGKRLVIDGHQIIINTTDVNIMEINMNIVDRFLNILSDPNIAYILLSIGMLGIIVEILNLGLIIPGIIGATSLILAFVSLNSLPVNWAGAALIIFGVLLLILEFSIASSGILAIGGTVCFILGSVFLFHSFGPGSPTSQPIGVSLWILIPIVSILIISVGWILKTILIQREMPKPTNYIHPVIGELAIVKSEIAPTGTVLLGTEVWTARDLYGNIIQTGKQVKVVAINGNILSVVET